MPVPTPIPLSPSLIEVGGAEFQAISGWPFADPFVARLLREDIPRRSVFSFCQIWAYRDPYNQLVGFGTLDFCRDYEAFTSGHIHAYIPLLAINPTIPSRGFGTSIVRHLIAEAAVR